MTDHLDEPVAAEEPVAKVTRTRKAEPVPETRSFATWAELLHTPRWLVGAAECTGRVLKADYSNLTQADFLALIESHK